jgi:hypothetical protein
MTELAEFEALSDLEATQCRRTSASWILSNGLAAAQALGERFREVQAKYAHLLGPKMMWRNAKYDLGSKGSQRCAEGATKSLSSRRLRPLPQLRLTPAQSLRPLLVFESRLESQHQPSSGNKVLNPRTGWSPSEKTYLANE